MATESVTSSDSPATAPRPTLISGRTRRLLRENLTAYAFLTPALLLIFTFGIFPILFASYVSLYKWRIRQNEWRGLENYVTAMGDVAYVFFFVIALALATVGIITGYRMWRTNQEKGLPNFIPLLYFLPALIIGFGMVQILLKAITFFAQEQAIQAGEASQLGSFWLGLLVVLVGVGLSIWVHQRAAGLAPPEISTASLPNFTIGALTAVLTLGAGIAIAIFTSNQLIESERYAVALIRTRYLLLSLVPLVIGYLVWSWGSKQTSNLKLGASIIGATILIAGGVWLATIWPEVSRESDADFYQSLTVTVMYSLGTVPFQLGISMVLAYMLFQEIKFKGFLRVVFFIPYVAPAVATAGIFNAMFTNRPQGFANSLIGALGGDPMRWIRESETAVSAFAQSFGIEGLSGWTAGPSLALVVVILYNIWVYVGYDTVIFLAGLGNIPNTLYEAAKIDGANRWHLFRHVTFPLLGPTTYFLSVISVIGTFKAFNHIYILRDPAAQGTIDTASIHFFVTFFRGSRFGYSTSMAMVLFVIILILYLIQNRIAARTVHYG